VLAGLDGTALTVAGVATGATWWAVTGYVLAGLLVLAGTGRHQPRITLRLGDELPGLLGCALLPGLLLVPAAGGGTLLVVPAVAVTLTAGRMVGYGLLRAARRRGLLAEPTLLLGAGELGREIAAILATHPEFGLIPYGFLDSRPPDPRAGHPADRPLPWLGDVSALRRVLAGHRIRRVIVCFPELPDAALLPVLRDTPASVCLVPRLYELGQAGTAARDEVWGIPVVPLRRPGRLAPLVKRGIDAVLAGLLLAVLAPGFAALTLLARRASGGPALFRQARVTGAGQVSRIVKLRTLPPDPGGDAAADTRWAGPGGCTRLGGLLRASHADELPQLVNVLRGEMSLVGPRPERPYFAAGFARRIPGYAARHRMPAGMTGWAQVHGLCGDTSVRERARFDNRYVDDWSLWTDLVILVRTVAVVCRRTVAAVSPGRPGKA
jgi:lipopolysaccharide/colanic/teichoic acid biosynthesis glycosyltransferase